MELEHERNINNITCEYVYTSPTKKKEANAINYLVYYESDEHADTIIDSSKQVDASNKPITDTHIVEEINHLSVVVVSVKPAVIGVGIIGRGITQCVISGRTSIVNNIVTDISSDSSKKLLETNTFQLNLLQSETLVIGPQDESVESNRKIICMSRDSRNIRGNHNRIETPGVNENVFIPRSDTTSNVLSCTGNVKKFDSLVHDSTTKERNLELSCIEKVGVKSIFPEIGKEFNSSVRLNLVNSVLSESPKFISLGHPTVETADILNIDLATSTRAKNLNRLRRGTERDDRLGYTHGFETMSETTAYCNHIKNSEIETRVAYG